MQEITLERKMQRIANLQKARLAPKGERVKTGNARLTPLKAIRYRCLDCMVGSADEVSKCVCPDCSLFEYRFGRRPTPDEAAAVKGIKVLRGK
jgi:hypothetical protein